MHSQIESRWLSLGGRTGPLGDRVDKEELDDGRFRWRFDNGWIEASPCEGIKPLCFLQQNMAFVPTYKGRNEELAIQSLLREITPGATREVSELPDVVGLSEVFTDKVRIRIAKAVHKWYRVAGWGPTEEDLDQSGGLMLLTRHPWTERHSTVYRQFAGNDSMANKGALHARLKVRGHPTKYDVFLTHMQDPDAEGKGKSQGALNDQMIHLDTFIRAYSSPTRPALLMGDLNTDAYSATVYNTMMARLGAIDLWPNNGPRRLTNDAHGAFEKASVPAPPDDSRRHKKGTRVDHVLAFPCTRFSTDFADPSICIYQFGEDPAEHYDISDHYGIEANLQGLCELQVHLDTPLTGFEVALVGFHCLEETDEAGMDEVYFGLACTTEKTTRKSVGSPLVNNVGTGKKHRFHPAPTVTIDKDPGDWVAIEVDGFEEDDWPNDDDSVGNVRMVLTRQELLDCYLQNREHMLPLLDYDGGQYGVTVRVRSR